jgi:hypothetical protein
MPAGRGTCFAMIPYDNGQIVEYLADLWALGQKEPAYEQPSPKP